MQKIKYLFLLLFIVSSAVSCQSNEATDDFNMTVSELKEVMKQTPIWLF